MASKKELPGLINHKNVIGISDLKVNPTNPRIIKDDKFKQLCQSIKDFPEMMALRPIVADQDGIIQGGNMRFQALVELKYKTIPIEWVKKITDFTPEQWKEFVIKDNVGFGEWNWDQLANEWNVEELASWGLDLPIPFEEPEEEPKSIPDYEICEHCGQPIKTK
jgi:ParB-like chromosome segregation protein Spo0J